MLLKLQASCQGCGTFLDRLHHFTLPDSMIASVRSYHILSAQCFCDICAIKQSPEIRTKLVSVEGISFHSVEETPIPSKLFCNRQSFLNISQEHHLFFNEV